MQPDQRQQIKKYIDIILRHKTIITSCLLLSIVAGTAVYLQTPKQFEASALIIYQRQKINTSSMSPDVQTRTTEMVNTLGQQVTSRTSLETIIKQFKLYPKLQERLPMQDVVDAMRKNVQIRPTTGDIFQVSFTHSERTKVALVTNALAARFIEENLRVREETVSDTSAYVKDELAISKERLDRKEALMRDYKLKYYNEMPQQLQVNMSRLNALQLQLQSTQEGLRDMERTRIMIQEQIAIRSEMLGQLSNVITNDGLNMNSPMGLPEQIQANRLLLENLQAKYTDKHPEVVKTKKILTQQEQEYSALISSPEAHSPESPSNELLQAFKTPAVLAQERQISDLTLQLKELSFDVMRLKESEQKHMEDIEQYKAWIDATPIREAEWSALTRDYDQLSNHYQGLVSQNLSAVSAETIERRQKGSQFRIIDSAQAPEKPSTPNFLKFMLMTLAIGCGLGGGLALVLEMIDTSFRDALDLESFLGLPVACAIPVIYTQAENKRNRIKMIIWTLLFLISTSTIFAGLLFLWWKGKIII